MSSENQNAYIPNPQAENEAIIQGFLSVIEQEIAHRSDSTQLIDAIRNASSALESAHQTWVVDEPSRYNLKLTATVLAAYRVLGPIVEQPSLLALIRKGFLEPIRPYVEKGTRATLEYSPDPFEALTEVSKTREETFFGKGFTFERERDDKDAYLVNVIRCFYHSFFVANGAPELTPIFCDFDASWVVMQK